MLILLYIYSDYSLENVVYLVFLRRGYEVYIIKIIDLEIDFVAVNSKGIEYYQVLRSVKEKNAFDRELEPLYLVKDNFPKYLLNNDIESETTYDVIRKINILDWLVDKN